MLKFFLKLLGFGGVGRYARVNNKSRIDPTMGVGPLPDEAGKLKVIGDNVWRRDPGGTWVIVCAWPHKVMRTEDLPILAPDGATFDIGDDRWVFFNGHWSKFGGLDNNGQFVSRLRQGHRLHTDHLHRRTTPRLPTRRTPYPVSPSHQREDDNMMNAVAAMSVLSMNSGNDYRSNDNDTGRHYSPSCHAPTHHDHGSYDSSPSDNSSPSCD